MSQTMAQQQSEATTVTLKVSGLGHNITLDAPSHATIASIKNEIEQQTGLPPAYQRLLSRGKNLNQDEETTTLADIGIEHRTKLMLLHSPLYGQDKEGLEKIQALEKELDELAEKSEQEEVTDVAVHELVTQICCKLDGIDVHGSEHLRSVRKKVLQKADELDPKSGTKWEMSYNETQSSVVIPPLSTKSEWLVMKKDDIYSKG